MTKGEKILNVSHLFHEKELILVEFSGHYR